MKRIRRTRSASLPAEAVESGTRLQMYWLKMVLLYMLSAVPEKSKTALRRPPRGVTHLKGDVTDYDGMKRIVDEIAGKSGLDFHCK